MRPARIDWLHRSNEQFKFRIELKQGPLRVPFDLSSYNALRMQVKAEPDQPEPEIDLALGSGLSLEGGGANGAINGISDVASIADLIGLYSYDILGTTTGGRAEVVCEGTIIFAQGVTVI